MGKLNFTIIKDIDVVRVKSGDGLAGAREAFNKLESKMSTLRGRKMYGVFYRDSEEYFSCVELDSENKDDIGFEHGIIPGGKYARVKIKNWTKRVNEIRQEFNNLEDGCINSGYQIDATRPSIEFYKSFVELLIMLPIK